LSNQAIQRIGIIGSSYGATVHLPSFVSQKNCEVVAIVDSGSGKASNIIPEECQYFEDWRKLFELPKLDAVVIATPPRHHFEIVSEMIENRVAVLCEKPFGLSINEASLMTERAAKAGVIGALGFQYRFEPGLSRLMELLREDAIGKLLHINISWITSGWADPERRWSWQNNAEEGGGVINAFFSHVADLISWIGNSPIRSIFGVSQVIINERVDIDNRLRKVTAEDEVQVMTVLDNGVKASARATNCQPAGTGMSIEVSGDKGRLLFTHKPPFTLNDVELLIAKKNEEPRVIPILPTDVSPSDSRLPAGRILAAEFLLMLNGKPSGIPTFNDGLKIHTALDALHSSIEQSRLITINNKKKCLKQHVP